jgi:Ca2+-binding EF-hand superfamily protein
MKTLLLSAGAAGSLALVGPALAQAAPDSQVTMEMHHGPMTRAGVVQMVQSHFAKLDSNHDGFLTKAEMDSAHDRTRSKVRTRIEKHMGEHGGDMPDRAAMFDRLDTNHDGSITRQEFTSAKPRVKERRVVVLNDGAAMAEHGKMGVRAHRMGMRMGGHMFEKADSNNDGKVSIQEATNAAAAHFDAADANHDGTLSPDEMRAAHEAMRAGAKS